MKYIMFRYDTVEVENGLYSVIISRTNVASVGGVFNDTRKVKVLSLPETIKEKSTFRAKALRRELQSRFLIINYVLFRSIVKQSLAFQTQTLQDKFVYVPYRLRCSVGGKLSIIDNQDLSTVTMDLSSFTPRNSKG